MEIRFCRDCGNFEDRRDIEGAALCKKIRGPYICCEEFEPKDEDMNPNRLYYRFCSECTNFEDINGTPLCARHHTPGVACEQFIERFSKLNITRQKNHMKTALIAYAISRSSDSTVPFSIIEVGRKIKW